MKFRVVAIGPRMPAWVKAAWQDYAKRFPRGLELSLQELPLAPRGKNTAAEAARAAESDSLLAQIANNNRCVALDQRGTPWSTSDLAGHFQSWLQQGRDTCFLIGGPDGFDERVEQRADHCWSLSRLTLPHMLVRVVVAEQLYRAWSVSQGHPYHRE